MTNLIDLERVIAREEIYILEVKIPKSMVTFFDMAFKSFEGLAGEIQSKVKLADLYSKERQTQMREDTRRRDELIKIEMRQMWRIMSNEGRSSKDIMKAVTKEFKDYSWIRASFKREFEASRDLEITRLHNQGLNSKQIADKLGLHPGTVRKRLGGMR